MRGWAQDNEEFCSTLTRVISLLVTGAFVWVTRWDITLQFCCTQKGRPAKIVGKSHKNSREKHLTLLKEKRMHKRHPHCSYPKNEARIQNPQNCTPRCQVHMVQTEKYLKYSLHKCVCSQVYLVNEVYCHMVVADRRKGQESLSREERESLIMQKGCWVRLWLTYYIFFPPNIAIVYVHTWYAA